MATNGHVLAVIPVEPEEGDTAGGVSVDAIKVIRKQKYGRQLMLRDDGVTANGTRFPRPDRGKYPDIDKVIPAKPKFAPTITLDARLLFQLAEAICETDGKGDKALMVSLWVRDPLSAVYVEPAIGPGIGVQMPCRNKKYDGQQSELEHLREELERAGR